MFTIDLSAYRIVDLSYEVIPPGTEDRPFQIQRGLLADNAYKYDILKTHTHVGTIDVSILPNGTAYVTDIGMTGPTDSVIGDDVDAVLQRFLTMIPNRLPVGKGKVIFSAMLINVDKKSGKATSIERIHEETEE